LGHAAFGQSIITTFAGRDWVFPLQSEPAVSAPISAIEELAVDSSGNLYIADSADNIVVKVDRSGNSTIFAGNGIAGYTGDGGAATSSSLNYPDAVTVDPAGNIYISDENNYRIRKVDTNGIITTIAGTGVNGYTADGLPAASSAIANPRQMSERHALLR
jgi:trimeric autotransporter adhesin